MITLEDTSEQLIVRVVEFDMETSNAADHLRSRLALAFGSCLDVGAQSSVVAISFEPNIVVNESSGRAYITELVNAVTIYCQAYKTAWEEIKEE